MDILAKIDMLRNERKWSIYKLSEESDVPQSTLANMFARKTLPSITTLQSLCDAFNISMSEFFYEPKDVYTMSDLTEEEKRFINNYRMLSV